MEPAIVPEPYQQKINRLLDPAYPLRKEEVIWTLEYIKKKAAELDLHMSDVSRSRLLHSYCCFAEAAMMLIHHRHPQEHEADRLKFWIREALDSIDPLKME